jgi:hypothetical protein
MDIATESGDHSAGNDDNDADYDGREVKNN